MRVLGIAIAVSFLVFLTGAVAAEPAGDSPDYRHSLELTPMSPVFRIYAIYYGYRVTPKDQILVGPYYANIKFADIGNTDAPGFIVGYRRDVWGKLALDYQLIPQWDHFYEENEDKRYPLGFDLWNEFRLGYTWDFEVASAPVFINAQWPFGFALYSDDSAKPESFKKKAREDPFFYFPPMFFLGVRF